MDLYIVCEGDSAQIAFERTSNLFVNFCEIPKQKKRKSEFEKAKKVCENEATRSEHSRRVDLEIGDVAVVAVNAHTGGAEARLTRAKRRRQTVRAQRGRQCGVLRRRQLCTYCTRMQTQ